MREIIGVESWIGILGLNQFVKREALLFDRIAIPFLNPILNSIIETQGKMKGVIAAVQNQTGVDFENNINEAFWLKEKGLLYEPQHQFENPILQNNIDYLKALSEIGQILPLLQNEIEKGNKKTLFRVIRAIHRDYELLRTDKELFNIFENLFQFFESLVRYFAIQIRELENLEAYPLLHKKINVSDSSSLNKTDVIQITLNALPIPEGTVSWEQIFDFRNDTESRHKFLDLRIWMNELATAKITPYEAEQKLEYLMSQYKRQVELHEMKTNTGMIETVIVTGAEIIEDLARVKFSKAAKALFSFRHRKIALIEGERNAKGNEIAYIIKAQNSFHKTEV